MATAVVFGQGGEALAPPAFLVLDTESVPDGRLLGKVKFPDEALAPEEAVRRAQAEARDRSRDGSDFLPVSFHYPVAACVLAVGPDFAPQAVHCLDAPHFRPRQITEAFWQGIAGSKEKYKERLKLVTFNGRGFDLPLLELAAFRYGCPGREYFANSRNRLAGGHLDLYDWLTNFGAARLSGGLNLLAKILGKPGKMAITGEQVYRLYLEGKVQEINDYCLFDTLDTYFVFLRTRVMTGDLSLEQEKRVGQRARDWLGARVGDFPALRQYLDHWGDWEPWPV
jgi:predicted PolB exonuclease-like 3'-5' exonuclease